MRRRLLVPLAAALASAVALGGAELVLLDGRVLRGDSVRREGDLYVLTTEAGETTMPADLVNAVRLTGEEEQAPPDRPIEGIPDGPTGLRDAGPQQLAGAPVEPPTTREQTRALGEPSKVQRSIVNSEWAPTTDWNMDPAVQNNWAPSKFAESPIDPEWHPESAYDSNKDVLADSRSTFAKSPVDSSWTPTDGFKKTGF
jgi:hypothetical protein